MLRPHLVLKALRSSIDIRVTRTISLCVSLWLDKISNVRWKMCHHDRRLSSDILRGFSNISAEAKKYRAVRNVRVEFEMSNERVRGEEKSGQINDDGYINYSSLPKCITHKNKPQVTNVDSRWQQTTALRSGLHVFRARLKGGPQVW